MEIDEYKHYVANGYCFYTAAKQLGKIKFQNGQADVVDVVRNFVPSTVNYAFSAELGLKAIIIKSHGELCKKHKLDELFDNLPDETRQFIITNLKNELLIGEDEVNSLIKDIANAFIEWRYFAFNQKSISINFKFLVKFCDYIYVYILKDLNK